MKCTLYFKKFAFVLVQMYALKINMKILKKGRFVFEYLSLCFVNISKENHLEFKELE